MSLIERLLDAGYPRDQMFHHESDLYVFATPLTKRVIDKWCNDNGYNRTRFCELFKDRITGKPMFDIAFAYDPYWLEASERGRANRQMWKDALTANNYEDFCLSFYDCSLCPLQYCEGSCCDAWVEWKKTL